MIALLLVLLVILSWASYIPGADGTYAQNYQDVWVLKVARLLNWTEGYFVDFGANDGIECSNTALLERAHGWRGVCVDPFPTNFHNRKCHVVSRAISTVDGDTVRFSGRGQTRHIDPSGSIKRKTVTVRTLLKDAGAPEFIHFASLDIEGLEAVVLDSFPWQHHSVGIWIVEHNNDYAKRIAIRRVLETRGYSQVPVDNPGVDDYYMLNKLIHSIKGGLQSELTSKPWRIHPWGSNGC